MTPFYALITPLASSGGGPGQPPSGAHPEHPIHYPWPGDPAFGRPPNWGTWGGAGQPGPFPPGGPVDPGYGAPPNWGTWGGSGQPGPFPKPPGIWGPTDPRPTPPIVLPPGSNVPPGADVIWPPPGPLTGPEHPITIVPPGKVMVYVNGWIIVDQPEATPAGDSEKK